MFNIFATPKEWEESGVVYKERLLANAARKAARKAAGNTAGNVLAKPIQVAGRFIGTGVQLVRGGANLLLDRKADAVKTGKQIGKGFFASAEEWKESGAVFKRRLLENAVKKQGTTSKTLAQETGRAVTAGTKLMIDGANSLLHRKTGPAKNRKKPAGAGKGKKPGEAAKDENPSKVTKGKNTGRVIKASNNSRCRKALHTLAKFTGAGLKAATNELAAGSTSGAREPMETDQDAVTNLSPSELKKQQEELAYYKQLKDDMKTAEKMQT